MPRVARSRLNLIRAITEGKTSVSDVSTLMAHLRWMVDRLDAAADLFERDLLLAQEKTTWLGTLEREWHQEPQWHEQRANGPRLRPDEWD